MMSDYFLKSCAAAPLRHLTGVVTIITVVVLLLHEALGQLASSSSACEAHLMNMGATRHARRHKRNTMMTQLEQLSVRLNHPPFVASSLRHMSESELRKLESSEVGPAEKLIQEAKCLLKPSDLGSVQQASTCIVGEFGFLSAELVVCRRWRLDFKPFDSRFATGLL